MLQLLFLIGAICAMTGCQEGVGGFLAGFFRLMVAGMVVVIAIAGMVIFGALIFAAFH